MKLTIFDDYSNSSNEILEFKNIWKYSLYFQDISAQNLLKNSENQIIDKLFEHCHSLCESLLSSKKYSYRFFGSWTNRHLDQFFLYRELSYENSFWESALKNQCVISALYTLLHHRLNNTKENFSYYFYGCHAQGMGYFSLKEKKIITDFDMPRKKRQHNKKDAKPNMHQKELQRNDNVPDPSDLSSNFTKLARKHIKRLSEHEQSILGCSPTQISLFNSDVFYKMYLIRDKYYKLKKMYEEDSLFSYENYLELLDFINNPSYCDGFKKKNIDIVDDILLQYKTERYYNFSLTECVLKSIVRFSASNKTTFTLNTIPMNLLKTVFLLPNVFSRNDFFKFALHSFLNNSTNSNFFSMRKSLPAAAYEIKGVEPSLYQTLIWLDLFRKFILFFSTIVFPIYEKCFFLLLKDYLDLKGNSNFETKAISILHDYIKTNAFSMKNPLATVQNKNLIEQPYKIKHKTNVEFESINTLAHNLLLEQNSIFKPSMTAFNDPHRTFTPSSNAHRDLMNVMIDSIINNFNM